MKSNELEKYSSAVTLSDMEIFIFPELLYSLVLANIMSPVIWSWLDDPWFSKLKKMNKYRRVMRLKQFIIDQYEFNLDLETWGLTTQGKEIERFSDLVDAETLSRSNALFGYEGDRYYFDIDIRRHFGLDKYTDDVIPYWKTETVESMGAFKQKDGYTRRAGECVSLAGLYAAALYIICEVPLEDIYLMATPLHSQNFIDVKDGVLTNNRRIVTKPMWFNGTELTDKAQRALRNEQVTIVSHSSGYVHTLYPEATINPEDYDRFQERLGSFMTTEVTLDILFSFLRFYSDMQRCFQLAHEHHGKTRYIPMEVAYRLEHDSRFRLDGQTRLKLLEEVDDDEAYTEPMADRIKLSELEAFFKANRIAFDDRDGLEALAGKLTCPQGRASEILRDLSDFIHTKPRLPHEGKSFVGGPAIRFEPGMSREEIIAYLEGIREENPVADLAFYAWRDLSRCDWLPFVAAVLNRNPVCVKRFEGASLDEAAEELQGMEPDSIYDGSRVAQPDEVVNFNRGDGLELAFCLATVIRSRCPGESLHLSVKATEVRLTGAGVDASFVSGKGLVKEIDL